MKKAINVNKGREATTNEVIKFVFLEAVKSTAEDLLETRKIGLGNDVEIEILEDEIHHVTKVLNAFTTKYKECEKIVTGKIQTTVEIITD